VRTVPDDPCRASLTLLAGDSAERRREFRGTEPHWLRLGTEPAADWQIVADGVAPTHCELLWDGRGLYVQDRLRLGSTFVARERVHAWSPVRDKSVLQLGRAVFWVEAPLQQPTKPDASVLRWVEEQAERWHERRRSSAPPVADCSDDEPAS